MSKRPVMKESALGLVVLVLGLAIAGAAAMTPWALVVCAALFLGWLLVRVGKVHVELLQAAYDAREQKAPVEKIDFEECA